MSTFYQNLKLIIGYYFFSQVFFYFSLRFLIYLVHIVLLFLIINFIFKIHSKWDILSLKRRIDLYFRRKQVENYI